MKRQVIACLLTIGLGFTAHAEDMRMYEPTYLVPATPTFWNWSGFYAGAQIGVASATFDPGQATNSMIANILRHTTIENEAQVSQWPQLPKSSATGQSYGGFVGFNSQWDDIILGLEVNYNTGRMSASGSDAIGRSFTASDGYLYDVNVSSRASVSIRDYGTLRARAGYVMGRFLPYFLVGGALGRADLTRTVTVALTGTDVTNVPPRPDVALGPTTQTERKGNAFIYGFSVGAGLDVGITQNIFLRAEYEYIQFYPFSGTQIGINTGRVGVALKF